MKCKICNAISKDSHLLPNKALYESDNFVLLPTIGPLEIGHVMLASKEHYNSLSEMGLNAIYEFKNILHEFSKKFDFFENILITEHGSFDQQMGGACIVHTHIHMIPNFSNCFNILDEILPIINITDVSNLNKINSPYILNMNNDGGIRIYEAYNSYSQIVRKAICNKYNRTDSDWSSNKKTNLIKDTIKLWKF